MYLIMKLVSDPMMQPYFLVWWYLNNA